MKRVYKSFFDKNTKNEKNEKILSLIKKVIQIKILKDYEDFKKMIFFENKSFNVQVANTALEKIINNQISQLKGVDLFRGLHFHSMKHKLLLLTKEGYQKLISGNSMNIYHL